MEEERKQFEAKLKKVEKGIEEHKRPAEKSKNRTTHRLGRTYDGESFDTWFHGSGHGVLVDKTKEPKCTSRRGPRVLDTEMGKHGRN